MSQRRTLISLFAGAGGLDLGLEQAGFNSKVANELEPQACETLKKNKELCNLSDLGLEQFIDNSLKQKCFKRLSIKEKELFFKRISKQRGKEKYLQETNVIEGDIRTISSSVFSTHLNGDELYCIAGGPPCQPFSKAGKQKSLDCAKNGDLFFEFIRLVKELKPKWFIFENVKGITFTKTELIYQKCNYCN
jgi:DNA (cytosine-5)-methyltransferase 1